MIRMKRSKIILMVILSACIALQFIQPARNKNGQVPANDFAKVYVVPVPVQTLLQNACYDCHSNNTRYPWYVHTQPMAWIMARHIKNGKAMLNFSEFGAYPTRRQASKLKDIAHTMQDNTMPLFSYTIMHKSANLSPSDKKLLIDWMQAKSDSLVQLK
jgi:hypothetical protein